MKPLLIILAVLFSTPCEAVNFRPRIDDRPPCSKRAELFLGEVRKIRTKDYWFLDGDLNWLFMDENGNIYCYWPGGT